MNNTATGFVNGNRIGDLGKAQQLGGSPCLATDRGEIAQQIDILKSNVQELMLVLEATAKTLDPILGAAYPKCEEKSCAETPLSSHSTVGCDLERLNRQLNYVIGEVGLLQQRIRI